MINRFSQFLVEEESAVFFTFGRMNPPTIGHGKLLDSLAKKAGRNPYRIYLSQTQDKSKNPLVYKEKVKHVRKMFPKHARSVIANNRVRTAIEALTVLYNEGFKKVNMIVGDDRIREFDILTNKYNGKKSRHGFYNFETIKVTSAGQRDPDAEGATGASATKQRNAAKENDFTSFSQGLPRAMSNSDSKKLFNDVRRGLGLKEKTEFKNHVQLEKVSETREKFVQGNLYKPGDKVVIKSTDEIGNVTVLGANYIIVECNGKSLRKWLQDVELVESKYDYGTTQSVNLMKKMTPGENKKSSNLWRQLQSRRNKDRGKK